ncbi:MAG TPA: ABC transporter ATP-binding protein [Candidatus Dormibacteraeota bacterium]
MLGVRGLRVHFPSADGRWVPVVDGLSFEIRRGEALGLVGESGAGKTMTALSLLGLVPPPGHVSGSLRLRGRELAGMGEREWWSVRGREVAMVFQDALSGLNPVRRIGSLLEEAVRRHYEGFPGALSRGWARERAVEALAEAGIPEPRERMGAYPHQLSGGLRQRVMIALATVNRPALIVADEPTTALDATLQAQVLDLLRARLPLSALLLVTHDLGVAAALCDRLLVVYAGRPAEDGPAEQVLTAPRHPYTAALLAAVPRLGRGGAPRPIPGQAPGFGEAPPACAFAPRCERAIEHCRRVRPPLEPLDDRLVACWNPVPP